MGISLTLCYVDNCIFFTILSDFQRDQAVEVWTLLPFSVIR